MDPDKLIEFGTRYLVDQSWAIMSTLRRPVLLYQPVAITESVTTIAGEQQESLSRLSPKVITFFAINTLLGTVINKVIPGRRDGPDLLVTLCVAFGFALVSGAVLHLIAKLVHGRGTLVETLSCYLQVSSTIFVVSSIAALIWGVVAEVPAIAELTKFRGPVQQALQQPMMIFFICNLGLQIFYLPIAIALTHRISRTGLVIALFGLIAVCSGAGVVVSWALYIAKGLVNNVLGVQPLE